MKMFLKMRNTIIKKGVGITFIYILLLIPGGAVFARDIPGSISEANEEFAQRRINLVRSWALEFATKADIHRIKDGEADAETDDEEAEEWPTGGSPPFRSASCRIILSGSRAVFKRHCPFFYFTLRIHSDIRRRIRS